MNILCIYGLEMMKERDMLQNFATIPKRDFCDAAALQCKCRLTKSALSSTAAIEEELSSCRDIQNLVTNCVFEDLVLLLLF